jgi:hypothetical protein
MQESRQEAGMARKKRDETIETGGLFGWQRWRLLIRIDEFWEDLDILNEKLFLFLDCAKADQGKFGNMAARRLWEYESLKKRTEDRWEIKPIPTWAILSGGVRPPTKALRESLESCYEYNTKGKPSGYPPVQVLQYHPVSDFLDLRLDLTKPLYSLRAGVEAEIKRLAKSATRKRLDKFDNYISVWDLRREGLSADEIVPKLWPKEYLKKGGRDSHIGDKGPLIQRVYDCANAAQNLIDSIRPQKLPSKIKK